MISALHFHPSQHPQENEFVSSFVAELIWPGKRNAFGPCATMGVLDGDQLIAGAVYHNWYPENGVIELSSASKSKRWLTKPVIRSMFGLPFDALGCQLVVLRVSDQNHNMVNIARKFGFSEVHLPRMRGREEGEFVFSYTDDQWRQSPYRKAGE